MKTCFQFISLKECGPANVSCCGFLKKTLAQERRGRRWKECKKVKRRAVDADVHA